MNQSQIHLALTHVPVILSFVGLAILVISLLKKNDTLTKTAYFIFLFAGLFAIPVYFTGEATEEIVEKMPGVSEAVIEKHEDFAKVAMAVLMVGLVLSLAGLFFYKKSSFSKIVKPIMLVVALASAGVMAQTAHLGGQIRHTEIRSGSSAQNVSLGEKQSQQIDQETGEDD